MFKSSSSMISIKFLLSINIIWYLLSIIRPGVNSIFSLNTDYIIYYPFELLTYFFLHNDYNHLFGNMLFLCIFGNELAKIIGNFRFIIYYLSCGIITGVVYSIFIRNVSLLGASPCIFGILTFLTLLTPNEKYFFIFDLKLKYLTITYFLVQIILLFTEVGSSTSYLSHIIGMIVTLIIYKIIK